MGVQVTYKFGDETFDDLPSVLQKHTMKTLSARIIAHGRTVNIQLANPKTKMELRRAEAFIARGAEAFKADSVVVSIAAAPGQEASETKREHES
jgi:hypothetical protein